MQFQIGGRRGCRWHLGVCVLDVLASKKGSWWGLAWSGSSRSEFMITHSCV